MLELIGRKNELFVDDITRLETEISSIISESKFLVLGGAGSIGQAVVKEIFCRSPLKLHVVDISENNLVELVRDIRSTIGYIKGEFKTFALDIGSIEYDSFILKDGEYDYVLNLSALKHVRSEEDAFTLMRMIQVNIKNTEKTIKQSVDKGVKKYFCVSTDKAANPVNMMGASKRIMEMFLMKYYDNIEISTARFANVAFSDGSLLHGFTQRINKKQPLAAPNDVKRYFVTFKEAGELCLLSTLFGERMDVFFPKLKQELNLITFSSIAKNFLESRGLIPYICNSEDEARNFFNTKEKNDKTWPCYFFKSDTTGEKDFEEFFTEKEIIDWESYSGVGVIKNNGDVEIDKINFFESEITKLRVAKKWEKEDLVKLFNYMIPEFGHQEKGMYLDGKM
jgi:FlaA1/EpsC-like NDP-sugar epimerase